MNEYKILTAIDCSKYSSLIVDRAIDQAKLMGGRIILLHCHRKFSVIESHAYHEDEMALIINEAEKLLTPFAERIRKSELTVEPRIMEEPAAAAISDIARIENCDLIIMGSRGLTNLASLIIGSVTNRVLQTAPCSVLVVR